MKHVFVETNWVVEYAAPSFFKEALPGADELLKRAREGEFLLEVPSISVAESRRAIQTRFSLKQADGDKTRRFLRWAVSEKLIGNDVREVATRALEQMELSIDRDLQQVDHRLQQLRRTPGLNIFDLDHAIAECCTELSFLDLDLKPFDQMILASILTRAQQLALHDAVELDFCEKDHDLQPWTKSGTSKPVLRSLFDTAGVWVYGDFTLSYPPRPSGWHGTRKPQ